MTPAAVEKVYETLAQSLDLIDPGKRQLYLAKLALLLAHELADAERACQLIEEAAQNLDA